jgi:hypothetical protein
MNLRCAFVLVVVVSFFASCVTPALKPGSYRRGTNSTEIIQPQNPKGSTRHDTESVWEADVLLPPSMTLTGALPVRVSGRETTRTVIGGAWADTVRDYAVRAANMRPIMYIGALVLVLVPLLTFRTWPTVAALGFGIGLLMVVTAQVLPGYEHVIVYGGLISFACGAGLLIWGWYRGKFDGK